jgi:hypothetical protein
VSVKKEEKMIKEDLKKMISIPRSKKIKEKICKDFYPNCSYCTCFSICFPTNETEDISSKTLLEQEKINLTESKSLLKALSVKNQ